MRNSLQFLSLCAAFAVVPMLGGCSSGSGNANDGNDQGGSASTGGSTSTGSGGNVGGTTSAGGSSATGSCTPTVLFNFNTTTQGFKLGDVVGTAPYVNLNAPGTAKVSGDPPLLQWASKDYDGNASPAGAMMITATFSDWNQSVSPEVTAPTDDNGNPVDFSKKILHAQVYLQKGLAPSPSSPGGVVFYVKTGSTYAWGAAPWMNLTTGGWMDVTFDTDNPGPGASVDFNPQLPVQIGFQISSNGGGGGGTAFGDPLQTIVYIDQITMVPNTCK